MRCLVNNSQPINFEFKEISAKLINNGAPDFDFIFKNGTQLSILKNEKGSQFLVTLVGILIVDFQKSFNLIRPLNDEQIANLSFDLINEYWGYKFEDFVAFFKLAKKGNYGRILDRMDENTIYSMLSIYDSQRVDELSNKQTIFQESKENLSPYARHDRNEKNNWFDDKSAQIGDFIHRLKNIKEK